MNRHTVHIRKIDGTDSGWKDAFGKVIPITAHEVLDSDGVIVASFWNNAPTLGNRTPQVCATCECRFLNGTLPSWGAMTGRKQDALDVAEDEARAERNAARVAKDSARIEADIRRHAVDEARC